MLEGDRHRRRRQLVMPSFNGDQIRSYGELICNITEKVFNQLPTDKPFSARSATQDISLQVILQTVFGMHKGEQSQQLKQRLAIMADLFRSPFTSSFLFFPFLQKYLGAWSPWGKFLRDRQQLDELLYAEIAERRRNNDADRIDILSLLMSAHDEAGNPMRDQDYKQLKGYSGVYRVDQGEYRILYKILEDAIEVFRVGKRNNDKVYENL